MSEYFVIRMPRSDCLPSVCVLKTCQWVRHCDVSIKSVKLKTSVGILGLWNISISLGHLSIREELRTGLWVLRHWDVLTTCRSVYHLKTGLWVLRLLRTGLWVLRLFELRTGLWVLCLFELRTGLWVLRLFELRTGLWVLHLLELRTGLWVLRLLELRTGLWVQVLHHSTISV